MTTLDANSWRQAGGIHVWRFAENLSNYPGWHLATDSAGLASLIDLLRRLRREPEAGALRTLHPGPPSPAVLARVNNRPSPVVSPRRVRIRKSGVAGQWTIAERDADVTVEAGDDHLDGILRWLATPDAAFDTTYGENPPIWFWGR